MSGYPELFFLYPNQYFVETGIHEGAGINNAIKAGFPNIRSVELSDQHFANAQATFGHLSNVKLYHGSSDLMLEEMIRDINAPITFWLDAHYSGDTTARGTKLSPILEELAIIGRHPIKTHTIMIDDRRLLGQEDFDFVTEESVCEHILKINPNYAITYNHGFGFVKDVLIAIPPYREVISSQ